jgi:hypothetical protein
MRAAALLVALAACAPPARERPDLWTIPPSTAHLEAVDATGGTVQARGAFLGQGRVLTAASILREAKSVRVHRLERVRAGDGVREEMVSYNAVVERADEASGLALLRAPALVDAPEFRDWVRAGAPLEPREPLFAHDATCQGIAAGSAHEKPGAVQAAIRLEPDAVGAALFVVRDFRLELAGVVSEVRADWITFIPARRIAEFLRLPERK